MTKKQFKKNKWKLPHWDYKQNLFLEPCLCHHECGNYILFIKGHKSHGKCNPNDFVDIASLDMEDLHDLYVNIMEKLDIENSKINLNKQFKKEKN